MGTITPILDTLLPQVLGRAGDVARVGARAASGPLAAVRPVSGEMSALVRGRASIYPSAETGGGAVQGAAAAGTRASAASADAPSAHDLARAIASGASAGNRSAELHLSRAGDVLARLLGEVSTARQSAAVAGVRPLIGDIPRAADLATILGQQVAGSGLFYESHLAAWVRGQFPRARLADEPQARLASAPATGGSGHGPAGDTSGASPTASAPIDPHLATLVRQQVELLASGVFQWHGEAWADAPMRWSIEQGPEDEASTDDAPATTALSLDLPGIGAFEARLQLAGGRVSVAAWAERGDGRDLVAADLKTLRARLEAAGFGAASVRLIAEPAA